MMGSTGGHSRGGHSQSGSGSGTGSSGRQWIPPTPEELAALLSGYEIVKMLGRGGMGAVYMGKQSSLDRAVAIKILSTDLVETEAGFVERFQKEARAMAKLEHPGIVAVYDFGETEDGLLYIVMQFVDGTDVARMIAADGRLHTDQAMAITAHVCDALGYAHERGIIHRDIKPANIMVGYDGVVKVADFGLAKARGGEGESIGLTQSGVVMGTMHYMAPEMMVLGSRDVDQRVDVYAVGVMLYHMLTGKVPHGMFELPSMQVPGLDPRYDGIIAKAMREDPDQRYQSVGELRSDLDAIMTQPVVHVEAPAEGESEMGVPALPTVARPQRPGGRRPRTRTGGTTLSRGKPATAAKSPAIPGWIWPVVALLMLATGGVGLWLWQQGASRSSPEWIDPGQADWGEERTPPDRFVGGNEVSEPEETRATLESSQPESVDTASAFVPASSSKAAPVGSAAPDAPPDDSALPPGAVSLFNGTDLTGWAGLSEYWSVENGAILGSAPPDSRDPSVSTLTSNTCLVWQGGTVRDFELTLRYRVAAYDGLSIGGNSGVHYRSRLVDPQNFIVSGYQADIDTEERWFGVLWEERGRGYLAKLGERVVIRPGSTRARPSIEVVGLLDQPAAILDGAIGGQTGETPAWNAYRIVARGNRLQHFINGRQTVDVVDETPEGAREGILAFQLHAKDPMRVWFKDIVLRELDAETVEGEEELTSRMSSAPGDANAGSETDSEVRVSAIIGEWWQRMEGAGDRAYRVLVYDDGSCTLDAAGSIHDGQWWFRETDLLITWENGVRCLFPLEQMSGGFVALLGTLEREGARVVSVQLARDENAALPVEVAAPAAADPAAESRPSWLVGRWNQTNEGKELPIYLLDLHADGTVLWASQRTQLEGTWRVREDVLAIDSENGSYYRIDLSDSGSTRVLDGFLHDVNGVTGTRVSTRLTKPVADGSPATGSGRVLTLFDGETLDGWKISGEPDAFEVDRGMIKGTETAGLLIYAGEGPETPDLTDFDLRMQVRTGPEANSGVWVHLREPVIRELAIALEVQIYHHAANYSTGSIFGIQSARLPDVRDREWFELRIVVEGRTITSFVNGEKILQWTQPERWNPPRNKPRSRLGSGTIGLQSMKGSEVWFKDIVLTVPD